jgi:hypothetical protein
LIEPDGVTFAKLAAANVVMQDIADFRADADTTYAATYDFDAKKISATSYGTAQPGQLF